MTKTLELLCYIAKDIDMVMHPSKPQYLVINSCDQDPFAVGDVAVAYTERYIFLGSPVLASSVAKRVPGFYVSNLHMVIFKFGQIYCDSLPYIYDIFILYNFFQISVYVIYFYFISL